MKKYFNLLLFCSCLAPLTASLMMTPKELKTLNSLVGNDVENHREWLNLEDMSADTELKAAQVIDAIYLGAILYFSPSNWTIWINDQTFTNENKEDSLLRILKVSNHVAEIEIKNASFNSVKLRPSQTLVTVDGRVVDGDAREKMPPADKAQL